MAERRMLLNSTEENFVGTMRIEYYVEGNKLYLGLNDNIKIIEEYFDDDSNGYYIVEFKKDLMVSENFINYSDYCEIEFISEYNIIFDTRSVYAAYPAFYGNFTFNKQSITSIDIQLFDYYYIFNYKCFDRFDSYGVVFFKGKTIRQYYKNDDDWGIYAYPHILYDLMKYNNVEEGDEEAQNYYILRLDKINILYISSPTEYITTIPNVDLGTTTDNITNYIRSIDNYMYEGQYITEYHCSKFITHLRTGITLPQDATVYFPDTVTDIDSDTFVKETNLKKVVIFGNCGLTYLDGFTESNLENIEIYNDKITDINDNCFYNCNKLTQFITPESVINIGFFTFNNTNLKSLYIPKNVSNIYDMLLTGSRNIETIIVDENNFKYDSRNNCNAIIHDNYLIQGCKNTIIPTDIDDIGPFAFDSMDLKEIIIPDNIIKIHQSAFFRNPIDNIIIPESVIYIDISCFDETNIYNNRNNWINGILYISNCIISVKKDISGEITILDNTRLICNNAFTRLSNITKINIPNSLKYINNSAFSDIGDLIIEYDGYEDEWDNIIKDNNWDVGTNITYIFKTDIVEPEQPDPEEPEVPEEEIPTFEGTPPNNQIWYTSTDEEIIKDPYIPTSNSDDTGLKITNKYYKGLGGVIQTNIDIIAIHEFSFESISNLKTIKFPNSLIYMNGTTSILYDCINLTSITIGNNFLGKDSYFNLTVKCPNLEIIDINENNPYFYDNNNTSMIRKEDKRLIQGTKNTIIPNDIKIISSDAFSGMNINNIDIPNSVEYIYSGAFRDNTNITKINLPDNIKYVEEHAFEGCINLNDINIPTNNLFMGNAIENTAIWNNEENWYNNGLYWDNALIYIRYTDGYDIYIVKSGTITICSYSAIGLSKGISIKLPNSVQNILDDAFRYSYVTELYYDGTVDEWNSINKSDLWNANSNITVIHCVDEDIQL